jgi:hypothetical protein
MLPDWTDLPELADSVVAAVSHSEYTAQPLAKLPAKLKNGCIFIDIKSNYQPEVIKADVYKLWRL